MVEKFFPDKSKSRIFLKDYFREHRKSFEKYNKYWTFVGFDSVDLNIGILVLKEMKLRADFGFFDSLHTTDHVKKNLKL